MLQNLKPQISRVSPFCSGDTTQIFGENLENANVYWWQPKTDFDNLEYNCEQHLPLTPPEDAVELSPDYFFEHVIYVKMALVENNPIKSGCAVLWLKNPHGFSKPFIVNRPEIWSISNNKANPNERVLLFGVNFGLYGRKKCILTGDNLVKPIELTWGMEAEQSAIAPNSGDFKTECRLPENIEDGEYQIRIHNGTGGEYGWSDPYSIRISNDKNYIEFCNKKWNIEPESDNEFNISGLLVKKISDEYAGGYTDATAILQSAIDEVSNAGGGVVLLPHGIFGITETLIIKPNVVLKGAGRGATTLTVLEGKTIKKQKFPIKYAKKNGTGTQWAIDWKPSFEKREATPFILIHSQAGIEDLKITDTDGAFASIMVANTENDISKNVFLNRVDIDEANRYTLLEYDEFAPAYCVLTASHTENFTMYKCNIIGPNPLFMLHAKHNFAHIIGNTFDVSPRQLTEVSINGANNCMIEQNNFINGRRTLMCQSSFNCNWIYQNRGSGVHRCANTLEAYMAELGGGAWVGKAESFTEDSIALSFDFENYPLEHRKRFGLVGENFDDLKTFLCIIKGKGFGQYRRVKKVEGNKIYIDKDWDVIPDETTVFSYSYPTWHNLWINNNQELSGGHSQFFYGSAMDNVIAGHQMLLSAGILCQGSTEIKGDDILAFGMVAYNRFINCETRASGKGLEFRSARYDMNINKRVYEGQPEDYNETMSIWGNIIKGNVFGGSSDLYYVKNQMTWYLDKHPVCMEIEGAYNIFEGNYILNYDTAVYMEDVGDGNYFNNNKIIGAKEFFTGKGVPIGPDAE